MVHDHSRNNNFVQPNVLAAMPTIMTVIMATMTVVEAQDLTGFGYPYTWPSSQGWFFLPPGIDDGSDVVFENVIVIQSCATLCTKEGDSLGGSYNPDTQQCLCYKKLVCLEPCIETNAIEFSTRPRFEFPSCEFSFCDDEYFGALIPNTFCEEVVEYDPVACQAKIDQVGRLVQNYTSFGYEHSWSSSSEGFQFQPPPSLGASTAIENPRGMETPDIGSGGQCAELCDAQQAPAGAWNSRDSICYCFDDTMQQDDDLLCLEPCLDDSGIEFSKSPMSSLSVCERSFCDELYYYNQNRQYCDITVRYDLAFAGCGLEFSPTTVPSAEPSAPPTMFPTTSAPTAPSPTMPATMPTTSPNGDGPTMSAGGGGGTSGAFSAITTTAIIVCVTAVLGLLLTISI